MKTRTQAGNGTSDVDVAATADSTGSEAEAAARLAAQAAKVREREMKRLDKRLTKAAAEEQKLERQLSKSRARRQKLERSLETLRSVGTGANTGGESPTRGAERADGVGADSHEATAPLEAYCVKEHRKFELTTATRVVLGNGRAALAGKCPSCGATIYRILGLAPAIVAPV